MLVESHRAALAAYAVVLLATAADAKPNANSMAVRERVDQVYDLEPGADVSVDTIAGPVTIETGQGTKAEIHIVRGAATARELACYRVKVEASRRRILIKHEQDTHRDGCDSIRSGQEVRLVLPRAVDVSLETIAGNVDVAPIDGQLKLNAVAGPVRARGVRSAQITALAGGLTMTAGPIDPRGVHISSVVGMTDITFAPGTNASVSVDSVMGNTTSPTIPIRWNNGRATARVGAGGPSVSVSAVVGHVTLHGS
jgi:DUF4097 and DUF4098 domain-containing protein YvlB